ncbi:MAG: GNAT family N-acetyltransferase [Clostridia bacterium]|nr:GNAT family N-acetyltransferase [Clostridia bacterium]
MKKLILSVYNEYEAPEYPAEGNRAFEASLTDPAYQKRLVYFAAYCGAKPCGVLAVRPEDGHICYCFVDPGMHRRGIGTALFAHALGELKLGTMTVNASPYGVPFYERLGFRATAGEQCVNGIRFIPMTREKEEGNK